MVMAALYRQAGRGALPKSFLSRYRGAMSPPARLPIVDAALAAFLQGEAMIIVGTHGEAGRPEIARAVGATMAAPDLVTLHISQWQWPQTLADLRANGRIAATFSRPEDYVSHQIKGRVRHILPADPAQCAAAARYSRTMAAVLARLGVPPAVSTPWREVRDLAAVTMAVEEVFVQTPGPGAGRRLA